MRNRRGGSVGVNTSTIIVPPQRARQELYARMKKRIKRQQQRIASDTANVKALNDAYQSSDKTPTLRKRNNPS